MEVRVVGDVDLFVKRRNPLELTDQCGDGESSWMNAMGLDQSEDQILEWSFLVSIMIVMQRMGTERNVAWRDDTSCSCMNTGWRLVKFMLA